MLSVNKKKGKAKQTQQQPQDLQPPSSQSSSEGAVGSRDESAGGTVAAGVGGAEQGNSGTVKILLNFKRYVFDPNKRMIQ